MHGTRELSTPICRLEDHAMPGGAPPPLRRSHYARIVLNARYSLLCSKLCPPNRCSPSTGSSRWVRVPWIQVQAFAGFSASSTCTSKHQKYLHFQLGKMLYLVLKYVCMLNIAVVMSLYRYLCLLWSVLALGSVCLYSKRLSS